MCPEHSLSADAEGRVGKDRAPDHNEGGPRGGSRLQTALQSTHTREHVQKDVDVKSVPVTRAPVDTEPRHHRPGVCHGNRL